MADDPTYRTNVFCLSRGSGVCASQMSYGEPAVSIGIGAGMYAPGGATPGYPHMGRSPAGPPVANYYEDGPTSGEYWTHLLAFLALVAMSIMLIVTHVDSYDGSPDNVKTWGLVIGSVLLGVSVCTSMAWCLRKCVPRY